MEYARAFSDADFERFSQYYTDDVVCALGGPGIVLRGKDAVVEFYREMFKTVRETLTLHRLIADDSGIAVDVTSQFTAIEDAPDFVVAPLRKGEFVRVPVFVHYELRDGRMVAADSSTSPAFRAAGVPGGGGYATAAGMAAFYQMLLGGGSLNGVRVLSPRVVQFATRNHSGDRPDTNTGIVQSRGMTPATKGAGVMPRAMGSIAPHGTFGHGGAGSSYSWGDPESGLSFTYLSNARLEDPWHTRRLDQLSTLVHAALVEP